MNSINWKAAEKPYKDLVCRTLLDFVFQFYEDPKNLETFREWEAEKREEQ